MKSLKLHVLFSLVTFFIQSSILAQDCDSVLRFCNLSSNSKINDSISRLTDFKTGQTILFIEDRKDYRNYRIILEKDSIISIDLIKVIWEMKKDTFCLKFSKRRADQYCEMADVPLIFSTPLKSKEIAKLNAKMTLNLDSNVVAFLKDTSQNHSGTKYYNIDGVRIRNSTFIYFKYILTMRNNCLEVEYGVSSKMNDHNPILKILKDLEESGSIVKKERKIYKSLDFKYYSEMGGAYYTYYQGFLRRGINKISRRIKNIRED